MNDHVLYTLGQILWFAMFAMPLITVPFAWRNFSINKIFRVLIGLVFAGCISFFLYWLSLELMLPHGFGSTVTTNFSDTIPDGSDTTIYNGNHSMTYSTEIDKLGRLLDLKTYPPVKVEFKYFLIDNSGKNERLAVPGPSDFTLEALLYFDTLTFGKILEAGKVVDSAMPNYQKSEFRFDWLDADVLTWLEDSDPDYHGHPDFFFHSKGKTWYLHNKILIRTSSAGM
jgi:hypothetical protein